MCLRYIFYIISCFYLNFAGACMIASSLVMMLASLCTHKRYCKTCRKELCATDNEYKQHQQPLPRIDVTQSETSIACDACKGYDKHSVQIIIEPIF